MADGPGMENLSPAGFIPWLVLRVDLMAGSS